MKHFDYSDVSALLRDDDLIGLLYADRGYPDLLAGLSVDDFLSIDQTLKVPFFAEVRDYLGARERENPKGTWIVKPIEGEGALQAAMGSICYFLDFYSHTVSAPTIVTKIGGRLHKATKIITKAEQLTGANYTDIPRLKEQLLLDLINRWIYCDEDRNPNNYMIRYTSKNEEVVIAIDFSNVDLLYEGIKIKGNEKKFGWDRMEKTRYLTPLKVEHFLGYDMQFFNMRLNGFKSVGRKMLADLAKTCLRFQPDRSVLARKIADNILQRIEYVREYFKGKFPAVLKSGQEKKYEDMGKTFRKIYGKEEKQ
jgi:hypothetical protein